MADQSLLDYFSGPAMTKLADSPLVKPSIPFFLDEALRRPSSARPVGINFTFDQYSGVRSTGAITNYDGAAVNVDVPGSNKRFGTCLGGRESFQIPDELVMAVKSNIPFVAGNAMAEFLRRVKNFRTRAETRRVNLVASALLRGKISYVPNNATGGKVCLSSAGSAITPVDFGVTNIALGGTLPSSAVVVPDFATAGTDIPAFLRELKDAFIRASNYVPMVIHYGKNIPSYLGTTNTAMQAYWSRNQNYGSQYLSTNEVPSGFADFTWVPAHRQYFLDETGTPAATAWCGADNIVITPAVSEEWWEFVEGSCKTPIGAIPVATGETIESILGAFEYRWGISGYTTVHPQTFQLGAVMQDYCLPVSKVPLAHWIVTVH